MGVTVRDACSNDAEDLVALIHELGFAATSEAVSARIDLLAQCGQPVLVAQDEEAVIGCLTWNVMPVLHRDTRVGRISMLVVTASRRSAGIGAKLVAEAERRVAALGCTLIEVTSNESRTDAHRFYERLGYGRTSIRFGKTLGEIR